MGGWEGEALRQSAKEAAEYSSAMLLPYERTVKVDDDPGQIIQDSFLICTGVLIALAIVGWLILLDSSGSW